MVTDTGGINDKSFNQSSWEGMQGAASASGGTITVKYLPSTSTSDYAKNISTFISQKCGVIVTVGFLMGDATEAAAKANPKQKFAIVDCSYASGCLTGTKEPNINQLVYNTVQDAFLGGYLAAGMTKTGKVATYGGMKFGTVTIYMDGFWDGVQYYNKQHHTHVQVLGWSYTSQNGTFAGSFTNITAGQTSPTRSSTMAPTSSSRWRAASGSARRRRSRPPTPPARTSTCSGWTPTAASAPRPTASTSSPAWKRASAPR